MVLLWLHSLVAAPDNGYGSPMRASSSAVIANAGSAPVTNKFFPSYLL